MRLQLSRFTVRRSHEGFFSPPLARDCEVASSSSSSRRRTARGRCQVCCKYYVMLCYAMVCYVMLCYVIVIVIVIVIVRCIILCYDILVDCIISYYMISYHIMLYYAGKLAVPARPRRRGRCQGRVQPAPV